MLCLRVNNNENFYPMNAMRTQFRCRVPCAKCNSIIIVSQTHLINKQCINVSSHFNVIHA